MICSSLPSVGARSPSFESLLDFAFALKTTTVMPSSTTARASEEPEPMYATMPERSVEVAMAYMRGG